MSNQDPATLAAPKPSPKPPHAPRCIETRGPVEKLLAAVWELHRTDKSVEGTKKITLGVSIVSLIAGFVTFVFLRIVPLGGIFLVGAVLFFVISRIVGRGDVDDRKVDAVWTLLHKLQHEMKGAVTLLLDFHGYAETKPLANTTGFFRGTGEKHFEKLWLRLRFFLKNGMQVDLTCKTVCKRKQRAKRKYTKIKDRIVDELVLDLRLPKGTSIDKGAGARIVQGFGSLNPRLRKCQTRGRVASFSFSTAPAVRLRSRAGWSLSCDENMLDGGKLLNAVALGCKTALAAGQLQSPR